MTDLREDTARRPRHIVHQTRETPQPDALWSPLYSPELVAIPYPGHPPKLQEWYECQRCGQTLQVTYPVAAATLIANLAEFCGRHDRCQGRSSAAEGNPAMPT